MELREVLVRTLGKVTADNLDKVRNHLVVRSDLISMRRNGTPSAIPWVRINPERSNVHTR